MTNAQEGRPRMFGLILLSFFVLSGCGDDDPAAPTPATPAALMADYQFQNSLTSSVGTAPALVDLGGPNTFGVATVDGASRTVLNFAQGDGVSLSPTTGVVPNSSYSVVVLFEFDLVNSYRRIWDPLNVTESDWGLYNWGGNLWYYDIATDDATASIAANTFVQVALTRDDSGGLAGYLDGVQKFAVVDSLGEAIISDGNIMNFFRDDVGGGEESAGSVARIRLYDGALTASQVSALDR